MGLFAIGELVVIPFPYSDLSASKMRPALIIAIVENKDYIMVQITSKSYDDKYSITISNKDLESGNLRFDSYAKYSKLFTGNNNIISSSIGKLKKNKVEDIINEIIRMLNESI